jgi:2-dehydropantoate 2-reductase
VVLKSWTTKEEQTIQVPLIEELDPLDYFDLVLVVIRKNKALAALPILAANCSANFLFLMNNAAGPDALIDALGKERVFTGFAGIAGFMEGNKVVFINAEPEREAEILLGVADSALTSRVEMIAAELEKGKFLKTKIMANMDAWLKNHVALLFPALATALYLCGNDNHRMANTRDAIVLAWRGIKEGFRVLKKVGIPVHPPELKKFLWLPEPFMVAFLRKLLKNQRMEVGMVRHAAAIRDEIQQLNDEFLELAERSGVFIPNIRFLIAQFNVKAPPLPEESKNLRMDWSGIIIPLLVMILVGLLFGLVF